MKLDWLRDFLDQFADRIDPPQPVCTWKGDRTGNEPETHENCPIHQTPMRLYWREETRCRKANDYEGYNKVWICERRKGHTGGCWPMADA